jgi:hypothetical protein
MGGVTWVGAGGHLLEPAADLQILPGQEAFGAGEVIREQAAARLQHTWQVQVSRMADAVLGASNSISNAAGGMAQLHTALEAHMVEAQAVLYSCCKRGDFNLLCRVLYTQPRSPLPEPPIMSGVVLPVATNLLLPGADAPLRRLGSSAAADVTARALQLLPAVAAEPLAAAGAPLLPAPLPADFLGGDMELDALMSGDLDSWELLGSEGGEALPGLQAEAPAKPGAGTPALEDVFDYLEVRAATPQPPQLPWEQPAVAASNPGLFLGGAVRQGLDAVLRVVRLTPQQASNLAASYRHLQEQLAAAAAAGPVLGAPWVPLSSTAGWHHPVLQRLLQESLAVKEFIWAWLGPQVRAGGGMAALLQGLNLCCPVAGLTNNLTEVAFARHVCIPQPTNLLMAVYCCAQDSSLQRVLRPHTHASSCHSPSHSLLLPAESPQPGAARGGLHCVLPRPAGCHGLGRGADAPMHLSPVSKSGAQPNRGAL